MAKAKVNIFLQRPDAIMQRLGERFAAPPTHGTREAEVQLAALVREMHPQLAEWVGMGYRATTIAKAIAPKGSAPNWETVRRAIVRELGLPRQKRKARTDEASVVESAGDTSNNTQRNARRNTSDTTSEQKAKVERNIREQAAPPLIEARPGSQQPTENAFSKLRGMD